MLCRGLRVCVAGGLEPRSLDFVFEGVEFGIRGGTVRSERKLNEVALWESSYSPFMVPNYRGTYSERKF